MSQEAYVRFGAELKDGGIMIVEQDLVRVAGLKQGVKVYSIPATRIAEELGKRMVLNSVMVGFFTAITQLLEPDAVRKAVADSVPPSSTATSCCRCPAGLAVALLHLPLRHWVQQLVGVNCPWRCVLDSSALRLMATGDTQDTEGEVSEHSSHRCRYLRMETVELLR